MIKKLITTLSISFILSITLINTVQAAQSKQYYINSNISTATVQTINYNSKIGGYILKIKDTNTSKILNIEMYKEDYNRNNLNRLKKSLQGKNVDYCKGNPDLSWEWNQYGNMYILFK